MDDIKTPKTEKPDIPAPKKFSVSDILEKTDGLSDFDAAVDPFGIQPPKPVIKSEPAAVASQTTVMPSVSKPASGAAVGMAAASGFKGILQNTYVKWGAAGFAVMLVIGASVFAGARFGARPAQMITDQADLDKSTLLIDSSTHTVGVASTSNPDGLQVGATVTTAPQGVANIRMGLLEGQAALLFEDGQNNLWQVKNTEGALEFIQGTEGRVKLDANALTLANSLNVNGNTTLGKDGNSTLTVQGNKVALPNGLNFDENTFVINASNNTVSVGTANSGGYKLLVSGSFRASSILSDGQVLAPAGSARSPSFSFSNNTNTGIFEPGINSVGISAGGNEVLRVQSGSVIAINANLEADGYVRAGRGGNNPAFQIMRFTGALDGSGMANIGTGLSNGYSRVLVADAWYQGGGGAAVPMSVDSVNGGNMVISGGVPGRAYRATLIYSQDAAGW